MDYFAQYEWLSICERIGRRLSKQSFETYKATTKEQVELVEKLKGYCKDIVQQRALGTNVMLVGTCGTGKDHLCFCVANAAHKAGMRINWINGEELFADARDSMDGRSTEAELVAKYTQPDFLWLSDPVPLRGELTEWQMRFLYRIIDSRYRSLKPILLTANADSQADLLKKLGSQIADRLMDSAIRCFCKWKSHRSGN